MKLQVCFSGAIEGTVEKMQVLKQDSIEWTFIGNRSYSLPDRMWMMFSRGHPQLGNIEFFMRGRGANQDLDVAEHKTRSFKERVCNSNIRAAMVYCYNRGDLDSVIWKEDL